MMYLIRGGDNKYNIIDFEKKKTTGWSKVPSNDFIGNYRSWDDFNELTTHDARVDYFNRRYKVLSYVTNYNDFIKDYPEIFI